MLNPGISFGIRFPGVEWLGLVVWLGLLGWWWQKKDLGLGLMLIGGLLNLGERYWLGGVRDYWQVPLLGVYNNINDWLIFGGAVIFLWRQIQQKRWK